MNRSFWLLAGLALCVTSLRADESPVNCPPGAKSCKIIVLTPEEETALIGDKMVFQTASQGRYIDLDPVVRYFLTKIAQAPSGKAEPAPGAHRVPPKIEVPSGAPAPSPRNSATPE
jgi:hypothetical protein